METREERMEKVKELHRSGYNCAQIVDEIYGRPDKTAVIVRVIICLSDGGGLRPGNR